MKVIEDISKILLKQKIVTSGIAIGYYWGKSLAIVVGSLVALHANNSR